MPRDPFAFYGLPPLANLKRPQSCRRGSQRACAAAAVSAGGGPHGHAAGWTRWSITRDLGLASWLLQLPRSRRPRVVYESHGHRADGRRGNAALLGKPELAPSPRKLAPARSPRASGSGAAPRRTSRITQRAGRRADGAVRRPARRVRRARTAPRPVRHLPPRCDRSRSIAGYAGPSVPWKGVDVFVRALAHAPGVHGLIVGGHPGEGRPRARRRAGPRAWVCESRVDDHRPGAAARGRDATGARLGAGAAEHGVGDFGAIHVAPEAVRVPARWAGRSWRRTSPRIREVLTDGQTALLVPPGDERALGAALLRLAERRRRRRAPGAAARGRWRRATPGTRARNGSKRALGGGARRHDFRMRSSASCGAPTAAARSR